MEGKVSPPERDLRGVGGERGRTHDLVGSGTGVSGSYRLRDGGGDGSTQGGRRVSRYTSGSWGVCFNFDLMPLPGGVDASEVDVLDGPPSPPLL